MENIEISFVIEIKVKMCRILNVKLKYFGFYLEMEIFELENVLERFYFRGYINYFMEKNLILNGSFMW